MGLTHQHVLSYNPKKTVLSNEKHVKNIHNAQKDKKKINYIDKML